MSQTSFVCTQMVSSIETVASPSDGLASHPGHLLGGGDLTPMQRCSQHILQSLQTGLLL